MIGQTDSFDVKERQKSGTFKGLAVRGQTDGVNIGEKSRRRYAVRGIALIVQTDSGDGKKT